MKKTTPTQIVYESGVRRKAKLASLKEKLQKEQDRLIAIWDRREQSKVKKKIEALDRIEQGKKPKKKPIKKLKKNEVLEVLQLLSRVMRADKYGNVKCMSSGVIYKRNEVCGGHYETRTNNVTAFMMDNIRPQCSKDNFIMSKGDHNADKVKERFRNNIRNEIGDLRMRNLETQIQKSRYTVNNIPDQNELQRLKDWGEAEIIKHMKGKDIIPNPLLAKILRKHGKAQYF